MQFSKLFTIALLALAERVLADSETFGMVSIRSGSALQYASVFSQDGTLVLGSNQDNFTATVTDDGKLRFGDDTYAVVQTDGTIIEGASADGTTGFGIASGHLTFQGIDGFYGIPATGYYTLSVKSTDTATGIALRAFSTTSSTGAVVPDFTATGNSTSTPGNATTTVTQAHTSTTTHCDETCTASKSTQAVTVQSDNGAYKMANGLGAGVFAIAALLL